MIPQPPAGLNTPSYGSAIPTFVKENGIARTNRFVANIAPPQAISLGNYLSGIEIEKAEIPAISIQTTEFQYDQSPRIQIPLIRSPQGTANIAIRLDEKHEYRLIFTEWLRNIIEIPQIPSTFTGYSKKYYNEYTGSVQIIQLGVDGKPKAGVSLLGAYPLAVESLSYDWADENQYQRLNVQFAYFEYYELNI